MELVNLNSLSFEWNVSRGIVAEWIERQTHGPMSSYTQTCEKATTPEYSPTRKKSGVCAIMFM